MSNNRAGNIPVLSVQGENLPDAWERAVLAVWDHGIDIRTEYDKPGDPPSRDATVTIEVVDPFAEPRIHKNFPGGPQELEVYRQEVVNGIHDDWVDPSDPNKWTYTYHQRLFAYAVTDDLENPDSSMPFAPVNQVELLLQKLTEAPHSRRCQAITWMPTADPKIYDPPCLQRLWARLIPVDGQNWILNLNTHWRSRDLYKAWFMNVYALTDLQRILAEDLSKRMGATVRPGRYVDISDSLHIYGSYFKEMEAEIERMRRSSYRERVWDSTHPAFVAMTEETLELLHQNRNFMRGTVR